MGWKIVLMVYTMFMPRSNRSNNDWIAEDSVELESAGSSSDASFQDLLALSVRLCTAVSYCAVDIRHIIDACVDISIS